MFGIKKKVVKKTSNKTIGNITENYIVEVFSKFDYWAKLMPTNFSGQPCDIVAIKDTKNVLCDAKNVEHGNTFYFNRIESNQENCFKLASHYNGIKNCGFVIYFKEYNTLKWLPYLIVETAKENGISGVKIDSLEDFSQFIKEI